MKVYEDLFERKVMVCADCGQEVRFGWRDRVSGWWHREETDHLGRPVVPHPAPYATPIYPEPEVPCHPITKDDLRPRSGPLQVFNLLGKEGWEVRRMTASRGPYITAKGEVSRTADSIVIGAVHSDGRRLVGVWVDVKFEAAYIGRGTHMVSCNATDLKNWIKGKHDLPDAVPDRES